MSPLLTGAGSARSLKFVLGMVEDAAFVIGVVKFGATRSGAMVDSKKYLTSGQHAYRRSYEIDPYRVPVVRVNC